MSLFLKKIGVFSIVFLSMFSLTACDAVLNDNPTGNIYLSEDSSNNNNNTLVSDDNIEDNTLLSDEIVDYIAPDVSEYDIMDSEYVSNFEPIIVADTDELTISIDSYVESENKFTVSLVNKTEDISLMFSLSNSSVNNIMFDPSWAAIVDPGDTIKSDIFFLNLYKIGVNQIRNIEMTFLAYNNNSWEDGYLINESVRLNIPLSDPDSATTKLTSNSGFEDIVLIDNNDITITVYDYDSTDDPTFKLYLQNKTDKTVMVCSDDEYVNSVVCDPSWAVLIAPGKNAYSTMSWKSDDLSKRNISSIHSVEILLKVYDRNDWEADYIVCKTVDWSV